MSLSVSRSGKDCCEESQSPDDALFKHLAAVYASRNEVMHRGDTCPPEKFKDGVTNGADWYSVKGMSSSGIVSGLE